MPLHAVDHVNLSIKKGETLGVVGESGCAESLHWEEPLILRLLEPTSGSVLYNGDDIVKYRPAKDLKEMRKKYADCLPARSICTPLNPRMSVSEIIAEPMITTKTLYQRSRASWDRVYQLMETVGLAERFIDSYLHRAGWRRDVSVLRTARALSVEPEFIVCDEPVSALDVSIQAQDLNLMMDLQDSMGLTYMFVTHNLSVIKHMTMTFAIMSQTCVELAPTEELFAHPEHPYTKALLNAIPIASLKYRKKLEIIKGEVTSPINPKPGCRFADRCEYASAAARKTD